MVECGGRVFENFDDVDKAGDAFWAATPPQQRLEVMLELNAQHWTNLGNDMTRIERVVRVIRLSDK